MRRATPILALFGLMAAGFYPLPAHADCSQDVATLRARLAQVIDQAKRVEAELLLTKAQKDQTAGRSDLCAVDIRHAALVATK